MAKPAPLKKPKITERKYLSQSDVPSCSLEQALRIPRAIIDEHAGQPTTPLDVGHALNVQPTTGPFRSLCGAAIAYGLTEGGYNADHIAVTDLARRIIANGNSGDGLSARQEATLRPRVIREFLQKYDGSKMPREDIALNVLGGLGVPAEARKRAYDLIIDASKTVKFFKEINGVSYVDLKHTPTPPPTSVEDAEERLGEPEVQAAVVPQTALRVVMPPTDNSQTDPRVSRVFVTHGRNRNLIPRLKELLEFGQLEPVVSVERDSVAQPVPDKVMADMRSCGAAVIHVDADEEVITADGEKKVILSGNVLIEIGAAMALYGRRFILLVREGIRLPSNLQGLYEVRYSGDTLDGDATLRLLRTFTDLKKLPLEKVG